MTFVSITRLRLRSVRFLPAFALQTRATLAQVRGSAGFIEGSLLPDRKWTFWTLTIWDSAVSMRAYITTGSHRVAMPKLMHWCDEASIAHYETEDAVLPRWQEADARMRREGRPSKLHRPSLDHQAMTFAPPRSFNGQPIRAS